MQQLLRANLGRHAVPYSIFCSAMIVAAVVLSGCSSVDNFGSRINDVNANAGDALNDETLLNIVRAANLQSPNFVGISQVTGSQTETLSTGLPNINFGPGQVAADHAYHLTNSLSSGVGGGFTSAPLVSTEFEQGILSPVGAKTLSLLLTAYPREVVFYALIESITIKHDGISYIFGSNPLNNLNKSGEYDQNCRSKFDNLSGKAQVSQPRVCNYEKFNRLLSVLIAGGLSAEVFTESPANAGDYRRQDKAAESAAQTPSGLNKSPSAQDAKNVTDKPKPTGTALAAGRFCFLPASDALYNAAGYFQAFRCGTPSKFGKTFSVSLGAAGEVEFSFLQVRSLVGFYTYLGFLLRNGATDRVSYRSTLDAVTLQHGDPFLRIDQGSGPHCIAEASYGGAQYCVPLGAYNTAALMSIAQQIRNLQITPNDLNTPFTVRLGGGQ